MKPEPRHNHEIWRTCPHCGEVWDARAHGLECPKCKKGKKPFKMNCFKSIFEE